MQRNVISVQLKLPPKIDNVTLRDKLIIYFQKEAVSGGIEVSDVVITSKKHDGATAVFVFFKYHEAVATVLTHTHHILQFGSQTVPLKIDPIPMEGFSKTPIDDENLESWVELNCYPEASSDEEELYGASGNNHFSQAQNNDGCSCPDKNSFGVVGNTRRIPSSSPLPYSNFKNDEKPVAIQSASNRNPNNQRQPTLMKNDYKCQRSESRVQQKNNIGHPEPRDAGRLSDFIDANEDESVLKECSIKHVNPPNAKRQREMKDSFSPMKKEHSGDGSNRIAGQDTKWIGKGRGKRAFRHVNISQRPGNKGEFHSRVPNIRGQSDGSHGEQYQKRDQFFKSTHDAQCHGKVEADCELQNPVDDSEAHTREEFTGFESDETQNATVEVSKFNSTTSEETLKMYFENKRKAGGGDIAEMTFNPDIAVITFCDPAVADVVIGRTHKLEGATLTVIPSEKKKKRSPRPVDPCRLILTGIPDGVEHDTLLLFIEGRTKIEDDPDIIYGERPGTALLTYNVNIADFDTVIKNFQKRQLKQTCITASYVEFADCILVKNLKPGTTQDTVELYFESKRKCGGGPVRDVQLNKEKNQAIVYFDNWRDVEHVTNRTHSLMGADLKVTIFYECLGAEVSTEGPTQRVPKPVVISVNPTIAEYVIKGGAPCRSRLEQSMRNVSVILEWPHEQNMDSIRLTPDTSNANNPGVWQDWAEKASKTLLEFFSEYEVKEFRVEHLFWEEICHQLLQLNLNTLRPVLRSDDGTIILLGSVAEVSHAVKQLSSLVDDLERAAEKAKQIIRKRIEMPPEKFKLLCLCRVKEEVEQHWKEVKFTLLPNSHEIECEGMAAEVGEAQLEIHDKLHKLSQHTVEISPNKSQFVNHVQDKIHEIFSTRNIHASCSTDGCKLVVTGASAQDTRRAIMFIKNDISEKTISEQNEATVKVLQSQKGKHCLGEVNDQKNALVSVNDKRVEVTGFNNDVEVALGIIGKFIEKNVIIEQRIKLMRGKVQYLTECAGKDLINISANNQQHSVTIRPLTGGKQSCFIVSGTKQGMKNAMQSLTILIERVVDQQHPVAKPGIPQLLRQDKGKRFLKSVEKECDCIVDTDSAGFDSFVEDTDRQVARHVVQILRQHTLPGGCKIMVCKGDLTTEHVDAIVNAANTKLEHVGGLAKSIVDAGGNNIQEESIAIIRKKGRELYTGEVVCTTPGKLPCRCVFHVAGPKWDSKSPKPMPGDDNTPEENLLWDSVRNVLREANRLKLQTVSIPAISSGVYGFPIYLCAKNVIDAVIEFCGKNTSSTLREIRFTNIDQRACDTFLTIFRQLYGEEDPYDSTSFTDFGSEDSGASGYLGRAVNSAYPLISVSQSGRDTIVTKENKTITLKRGDLAAEKVDVLVNTTSSNVQLAVGGVSKAILAAAGPALQKECQAVLAQSGNSSLGAGGILQTGPAALTCKTVYHTVCDHYNGTTSESMLDSLVTNVLQQANQAGMQSIALPAIGTGNLRFPHNVAAKIMFTSAVIFSKQNPRSSLVDIRFVVFPGDRLTVQAFQSEMQHSVQQGVHTSARDATHGANKNIEPRQLRQPTQSPKERSRVGSSGSKYYKGFQTLPSGTTKMQIGPIRVQICHGDLTKESTEAIVNSVGENLDLQGPVSQAIIREGGPSIEHECRRIRKLGGKQLTNGVVKTSAGTLTCKSIIHVVTPNNLRDLDEMVGKALRLAEREGCRSMAFPALGTGNINGDPDKAASALLDAIGNFAANEKVQSLFFIKLTIYKQNMMKVFQDTMSSKEGVSYGPSKKSLFQRGAAMVKWAWSKIQDVPGNEPIGGAHSDSTGTDVDSATETMILHIFAGSMRSLRQAKEKIDEFIDEEFCREEMPYEREVWGELSREMMNRIFKIARDNSVNIEPLMDGKAKRIVIEGRAVDVHSAKAEIQKYFTDIQLEKKRELEDQLFNSEVQWHFKDAANDQLVYYGDTINPLIERAYKDQKRYRELDLVDGTVRIYFATMKEKDLNGSKMDVEVQRIDLKKVSKFSLPPNWIPMNAGQNSLAVKLVQPSKEYSNVESLFLSSIGRNITIIEIQRIQNKELLKQYTAKKERISASIKAGFKVERQVYHGTAQSSCDKINTNGFNRGFHGVNGTALGKGTYFAKDASYSNGYAKPSGPNNYQHMYLCRVLTGEYAIGNASMMTPPAKPGNISEMYDSVVNQQPKPTVFVVFHDAQAYPEYLIIYK